MDFEILVDQVQDGDGVRFYCRVNPSTPAAEAAIAAGMRVVFETQQGPGWSEVARVGQAVADAPTAVLPLGDTGGSPLGVASPAALALADVFRGASTSTIRVRLLQLDGQQRAETSAVNNRQYPTP